jgi:hypothetical protein
MNHVRDSYASSRAINLAHPARADLRADFVAAEVCASGDAHSDVPAEKYTQIANV